MLEKDLDVEEMSLEHAEKEIKSYADKHKTGNFSYVSPAKAEEILRNFYGLPLRNEKKDSKKDSGVIDIADFL